MIDLVELRLAVYRWFADTGDAPTDVDLAESLAASVRDVQEGLWALHEAHLLVLASDGSIVMAHPWAARDLGFVVASSTQKWWGGCVWDSLSIATVLDVDVLVATRCPWCGRALGLWVDRVDGPRGEGVAHLLTPVARMWDDVVHTCSNQRLFCSDDHVESWRGREDLSRGAVLALPTLWRLASRWYDGRMTPSYRRRTAPEAAAFFTGVGLVGDFWAVPGG